ncbi:ERF family protein [Limosilactobacillus fermentum]|uniref:ERF family protein n=1 Tax=Limosilactobacillus fermentum TaxID=1613 RepID=UPI00326778A2
MAEETKQTASEPKLPYITWVQSNLVAPKNQRNNYGGYNYRSVEDIMEAVKPLITKACCQLTMDTQPVLVGDAIYIKAEATFKDPDGNTITSNGWAREAESQKGMQPAQITGSSTSYAQKRALGSLFLITDEKDDDFNNHSTANNSNYNNNKNYNNYNNYNNQYGGQQ